MNLLLNNGSFIRIIDEISNESHINMQIFLYVHHLLKFQLKNLTGEKIKNSI